MSEKENQNWKFINKYVALRTWHFKTQGIQSNQYIQEKVNIYAHTRKEERFKVIRIRHTKKGLIKTMDHVFFSSRNL